MSDAWNLLLDLGLPDGAIRPPPTRRIESEVVRAAILEVVRSPDLTVAKVAPLLAWLRAWNHHWPTRLMEVLGGDRKTILDDLGARLDDENRYLKLRRIAIANLSGIL